LYAVNETITAAIILIDSNGDPVTGATVTAKYGKKGTAFSSWSTATVTEEGGGIYRADFTPNSSGHWGVRFDCTTPNYTGAKFFPVGIGQEDDVETKVDTIDSIVDTILVESQSHPTLAEIEAGDMVSIKTETDKIPTLLTESQSHPTLTEIEAGDMTLIKTETDKISTLLTESQSHPTLAEIEAGDLATILADTPYVHDQAISTPTTGSIAERIERLEGESPQEGTHSHQNNTDEQTVVIITLTSRMKIWSIDLDVFTLTKSTTFRIYKKVDGSTYRVADTYEWTTSDEDCIVISAPFVHDHDIKVTMQSSALEGAIRSVPYSIMKEQMD